MTSKRGLTLFSALLVISLFFLNGCRGLFLTSVQANSLKYHGPLKVALQEDLIAKSLEKDLILNFAQTHSIKIVFISFKDLREAETLLNQEKADLVFTRSPLREADFQGHHSTIYDDLKLAVVCSQKSDAVADLYIPNRYLHVIRTESFIKSFKARNWITTSLSNAKLKKLSLESNICFLADSRLAQKNVLSYPQLQQIWLADKPDYVAWVTRTDLNELNGLIYSWFQGLVRQNQIRKFWDQYEAFDFKMTVLEQRRFQKDMNQKLPQWKKLFEKAAEKNQIPWTLLAAVAYQESKWDEDARSYTGVRGLMQITTKTAEHIGIEDREDPAQSIDGGAYYLKYLYDKTSPKSSSYERWAEALAAYNIGWAHIRDSHRLAKKVNVDSHRWLQFKTVLPLLGHSLYASDLAFGSARGEETVEFVDQVFGYTELLNNSFTRRLLTSQDF